MKTKVGELIEKARKEKKLSMRQLAEQAKVSHSDISRIESGEREVPNPKILRKISKHIGVNYNDLMYAAGLGFQVTNLNPFLRNYYQNLKGTQIDDALYSTQASKENWEQLVKSFSKKLNDKSLLDQEKEVIEQTIEDTEYQINTAAEIIKVLLSAKVLDKQRKNEDIEK